MCCVIALLQTTVQTATKQSEGGQLTIAAQVKACAVHAGCATVAEVRKRGDDFWGEFEFYLSDLVVGCVLDCVLVGLLAPSAVIGAKPKTKPTGEPNNTFGRARLTLILSRFNDGITCFDGDEVQLLQHKSSLYCLHGMRVRDVDNGSAACT